jgi:CHAT domain-containing protein
VLSACFTASGESGGPISSESLVRAFLVAGVRNVIASRWNADSEAARALFENFYRRLQAGQSPADALHQSVLHVASLPDMSHPYYWAAFSLFS